MKRLILVVAIFFFSVANYASASWAYAFVVYAGKTYVVSQDQLDPHLIDKRIGKVTSFSTDELAHVRGNFSNIYHAGTEYYSIKGVSEDKEIAIKIDSNTFVKATYNGLGSNTGKNGRNFLKVSIYILLGILVLIGWIWIMIRKNKIR